MLVGEGVSSEGETFSKSLSRSTRAEFLEELDTALVFIALVSASPPCSLQVELETYFGILLTEREGKASAESENWVTFSTGGEGLLSLSGAIGIIVIC